jgi:hypothetical protein
MNLPSNIIDTARLADDCSTSSLSASPDVDREVEVIETPTAIPPHPIETATIDDVALVADTDDLVPVGRLGDGSTRILSIKGYPIGKISTAILRKFCGYNHIVDPIEGKSLQKKTKLAACIAIVAFKDDPTLRRTLANAKKTSSTASSPVSVNRFRLANVVFGEICKDKMSARGQALDRDCLDAGRKGDQNLFELVASEYNSDNTLYGSDHFPSAALIDFKRNDPAIFQEITWRDAQRVFKEAVKLYETSYQNWKVSGNHEDLENSLPFSSFTKCQYVMYWHEFLQINKGLLAKFAGFLPEDVFFESCERASMKTAQTRKRKSDNSAVAMKEFNDLVAVSSSVTVEKDKVILNRQKNLRFQESQAYARSAQDLYEDLLRKLQNEKGGKLAAKEALREYRNNSDDDSDEEVSIGSVDSLVAKVSTAYDNWCRAKRQAKVLGKQLEDDTFVVAKVS